MIAKEKRFKFSMNKAQHELLKHKSIPEVMEMVGINNSQAYILRANRAKDYRVSTLDRLAKGLGFATLEDFLNLK